MDINFLKEEFGSFMLWKINEETWVISFMGGTEFIYLLEGSEKALLLDTGYGTGNLRDCVSRCTNRELIVANTHYHPDHAGGNGEFRRVYMHRDWQLDENTLKTQAGGTPFDLSELPYPDYEHAVIEDGAVLDLGGREVEVIYAAAHSNSSLFFLDRKYGMLFCGDELEAGQVLLYDLSKSGREYDFAERLKNHRANMARLAGRRKEIKYVCPNHNGTPISAEYIDDFIALADGIYAGTAVIEDELHHKYIEMSPESRELCRVKCGHASFFVNKKQLLTVYGKEENR